MAIGIGREVRQGLVAGILLGLLAAGLPASMAEAAVPPDRAELVGRVIELTNAERARQGLPALTYDRRLKRAAQKYAKLMVASGCDGHFCGGTDPSERIATQGYTPSRARGENVHPGPTPDAAVGWWMSSDIHRSNVLRSSYTHIGVGVAIRPDGQVRYVQVFAG